MPSLSGIAYRVEYRRASWKPGNWKYKLFLSEEAATRYVAHLHTPVTKDTPEKFRNLSPVTTRISYAAVRWVPLDVHAEVEPPAEPEPESVVEEDPYENPCPIQCGQPGCVREEHWT